MPVRRRRQQQQMSSPQIAGLVTIVGLCAGYLYFVSHSPLIMKVSVAEATFRRIETPQRNHCHAEATHP